MAIAAAIPTARPAQDDAGHVLDADWAVMPAEAVAGLPGVAQPGERRFVLMHPAHGIAILDLWPAPPRPAPLLDAELRLAGILRRLDPRLPVRRIHLAEAELPRLAGVVARAYAGTEPLAMPDGEAWTAAVRASLAASLAGAITTQAPRRRRLARRHRLGAGIVTLMLIGAFGLLAAGRHIFAEGTQQTPAAAALEQDSAGPDATAPAQLALADPAPLPADPAPVREVPSPAPPASLHEIAGVEPVPEPAGATLPIAVASREGVQAEALPEPGTPPAALPDATIAEAARAEPPVAPVGAASPPAATRRVGRRGGRRAGALLKPLGTAAPVIREVRPSRLSPAGEERKPPSAQRR